MKNYQILKFFIRRIYRDAIKYIKSRAPPQKLRQKIRMAIEVLQLQDSQKREKVLEIPFYKEEEELMKMRFSINLKHETEISQSIREAMLSTFLLYFDL